jgi:hypothetical protein
MKKLFILGFLFVCTIAVHAQNYESPADLENYNYNWTFTYNDSMAATGTAAVIKLLPAGKRFNVIVTARGANLVYKTTLNSAIQPHWMILLQNESDTYAGTTGIDSVIFKASSGTGAMEVKWSKF